MKKVFLLFIVTLTCGVAVDAQSTTPEAKPTTTIAEKQSSPKPMPAVAPAKSTRGPVFRPTKEQIKEVQAMLKAKTIYTGEASGTYNDETRAGIKVFQKDNGLKETGTLNRATLEKMGIELTENQKLIPVSENSYASADGEKVKEPVKLSSAAPDDDKAKRVIFRATKDQILEAQRMLKAKSMYSGDETGKLDDATRAGLKKFQEASEIKVTGTLNQITLEKMGIALTDKQKEATTNK
ncbi:MAG: peptidoglycan-binding protein [Saprospiraceae bacterium]|nr:peptidoglycan-binding protein [Pyrinomonadaceae bacterium]